MPHRDPETGQFVAGTGATHFDDYEFVHVNSQYSVSSGDLPDAFPIEESDIREISLDDIMDRDERADLVAIVIHALQASVPGTTSAEAALEARWELHAGVGDEMILPGDGDFDVDSGSSDVVDIFAWHSDSADVLYHANWEAEGGFADSTNGLGGGPDAPVLDQTVNYPREYGSCPTFDDRDEITESFFLEDTGGAGISDSLVRLKASYTLVFAVRDRSM